MSAARRPPSPPPKARPTQAAPWAIVEAELVAGAARYQDLPPSTDREVAFAGRSNVGKSSLMNALMGRKNLVRTSSTPGCTRAINIFSARAKDGLELCLVDLPGYGYAHRSKSERNAWGQLIEAYLLRRESLRAVVLLCDARRGVETEERQLVEFLASHPPPRPEVILVATKIDRIPSSKRKAAVDALHAKHRGRVVAASATEGDGIAELWREIRRLATHGAGGNT